MYKYYLMRIYTIFFLLIKIQDQNNLKFTVPEDYSSNDNIPCKNVFLLGLRTFFSLVKLS